MPLITKLVLIFSFLFVSPIHEDTELEWGFYGHRKINRLAVFTLPPQMIGFYKKNIDLITRQSVNPDMRRYSTEHEAIRHYVDLDEHIGDVSDEFTTQLHEAIAYHTTIYAVNENADSTLLINTIKFLNQTEAEISNNRVHVERDGFLNWNKKMVKYGQREEYKSSFSPDELPAWLSVKSKRRAKEIVVVDNFSKHGIAPYFLEHMFYRLVSAFKDKDGKRIITVSAELGHYFSDIHVPLHTTKNYNGADTDQIGIHAFWESRLPELYADRDYDFMVGKAEYIPDPNALIWETVLESFALVPDVLAAEKQLSATFPEDQQYCYEERRNRTIRLECEEYANAFHEVIGGMVERRMQESISSVGSFWYSAWVGAGQPDLTNLTKDINWGKEDDAKEKELSTRFQSGEIKGRKHTN